jgi:Poly(hydroxyalcanoate) granule associated protein (phasin)
MPAKKTKGRKTMRRRPAGRARRAPAARRTSGATRRTRRTPARTSARASGVRRGGKGLTRFERTWRDALRALSAAETQAEKEIRAFVKRSGIDTRQAAAIWKHWNARLDRESRKAARRLEAGLSGLQERVRKERRALSRMVDDAVQGAFAALNVPSRQEVKDLTRKVNQLSRKIDAFRR